MTGILKLVCISCLALSAAANAEEDSFSGDAAPFLEKYCINCHGGEKTKGHVNFLAIGNLAQAHKKHALWENVVEVLESGDMPPEDEPQPSPAELEAFNGWHQENFININARPADARLRRLSVHEFRNSLRSLMGFDLKVKTIATPETVTEDSLVIKMLPPDPPGTSGFTNDTANAPLTPVHWEKYTFLTSMAVENLFSAENRAHLEVYTGPIEGSITPSQVKLLVEKFTQRAFKKFDCDAEFQKSDSRMSAAFKGKIPPEEIAKTELRSVLLSPQFLFNGHHMPDEKGVQPVTGAELAQRMSYFLWGTVPDEQLLSLAHSGKLFQASVLQEQVDRMLDDEKSRVSTEILAREWFVLDEMKNSERGVARFHAIYNQPVLFVDYLIRENRPLLELIDSDVTFSNYHLRQYYHKKDLEAAPPQTKSRGTEIALFDHYRLELKHTKERGGIITMPGILKMYSSGKRTSPILRGVWVLERVLGEELGEAPEDVPAFKPPKEGEEFTFRQAFERHQADKSCSVCHSKIDPIGFGLEDYAGRGEFRAGEEGIDSSGETPDGSKFEDFSGLKEILTTKYGDQIYRNVVERIFLYAMARELQSFDRPAIDAITAKMISEDGGYRDLIKEIVTSRSFTHTHKK